MMGVVEANDERWTEDLNFEPVISGFDLVYEFHPTGIGRHNLRVDVVVDQKMSAVIHLREAERLRADSEIFADALRETSTTAAHISLPSGRTARWSVGAITFDRDSPAEKTSLFR